MSALSVKGLHKAYGRQPVLRGVDLEVAVGSLTAILGSSGSGKTTLLRVIAGFERADAGTVAIGDLIVDDADGGAPSGFRGGARGGREGAGREGGGHERGGREHDGGWRDGRGRDGHEGGGYGRGGRERDVREPDGRTRGDSRHWHHGDHHRVVAPDRRRIGYVPQEGALFPHLTVAGNVAFGLGRRARHGARVLRYLDMVGMGAYASRYPHQLSGGQQQRVALARALAIEPDLVLLDEPFSSLDASMRASLRLDVLAVLRHADTTAVLVTHDQDEALSMADNVAVLRDGVIIQAGTPEELYTRPIDQELARFLGDANLIEGEVDPTGAGRVVRTALGVLSLQDGVPSLASERATVLLRPEQLSLDPSGAGRPGAVLSCEYYGHDAMMRVRLDTNDGEGLWVRVAGDRALAPGTHVGLAATGAVQAWPATPVAVATSAPDAVPASAPSAAAV